MLDPKLGLVLIRRLTVVKETSEARLHKLKNKQLSSLKLIYLQYVVQTIIYFT